MVLCIIERSTYNTIVFGFRSSCLAPRSVSPLSTGISGFAFTSPSLVSLWLPSFPSKMLPTATSTPSALGNPAAATAAVKTEVDLDVKKSFEASTHLHIYDV